MRFSTLAIIGIALLLLLPRLASIGGATLPNHQLTPGAVATTSRATVCQPGYASSVRPRGELWRELKDRVYAKYGYPRGQRYGFQIDHLVSLELGGDPGRVTRDAAGRVVGADIRNLWPQPYEEAKRKDQIENELHLAVCDHGLALNEAQVRIARDWTTALPANIQFTPAEQDWLRRTAQER